MAQPDFMYANTVDLDDTEAVSNGHHSRQSSYSSGHSLGSNKENGSLGKQASRAGSELSSDASDSQLILRDGGELLGESRTDLTSGLFTYDNSAMHSETTDQFLPLPQIPGRQPSKAMAPAGSAKAKAAKSPFTAVPTSTIPTEEITIPNDANISNFTVDQVANFLRCFKVDERIVSHLHNKAVDGKRFARFKDSELESLGMKNAAIVFFRDKSNISKHQKKKGQFML
ncbi:uncharacterized protein LOC106058952 isoform X2 [Biomphalaria glabrata]|nr:uncharacterized protein LOC106058952 isoform X2 [Biomphalaria glabrata]XP_055884659.1 uncharacterized protein LOC106058952 isoform X2 [Biomphalaria glabrata]